MSLSNPYPEHIAYDDEIVCGQKAPESGLICTQQKNHPGPHVAEITLGDVVCIWHVFTNPPPST